MDGARRYEIAGTIAGDDTILLIPRDGITLQQVHTCLEIILPGIHEQIKKKLKYFNFKVMKKKWFSRTVVDWIPR
ncbi:MAG: hypothetical protein IPN67_03920 [Bacteroidales bacterium]|nr:hypothetical protein [Bacteroidales bacterium]